MLGPAFAICFDLLRSALLADDSTVDINEEWLRLTRRDSA
jgi:hypothetical protein